MTTAPSPDRAARMNALLTQALAPTALTIVDDSASHAGHAGAQAGGQTHYNVTIVTDKFTGNSRVERHRLVHQLLAEEFSTGLHAIALVLKTPAELAKT